MTNLWGQADAQKTDRDQKMRHPTGEESLAASSLQIIKKAVECCEPHEAMVFIMIEIIGWKPKDIVELFSSFTLSKLASELARALEDRKEHWGRSHEVLAEKLQSLTAGKSVGNKRLCDYWQNPPLLQRIFGGSDPKRYVRYWNLLATRKIDRALQR